MPKYSREEVENLINRIKKAPVGEAVYHKSQKQYFKKQESKPVTVSMEPREFSFRRLFSKIAYEFLWFIGANIFLRRVDLADPLKALSYSGVECEDIKIIRVKPRVNEYDWFHAITIYDSPLSLLLHVTLFGFVEYMVLVPDKLNLFQEIATLYGKVCEVENIQGFDYQQSVNENKDGLRILLPDDDYKDVSCLLP